jgi:hypothetical protein
MCYCAISSYCHCHRVLVDAPSARGGIAIASIANGHWPSTMQLTISVAVILVYLNVGGVIFWVLEGMQDQNYTPDGKKNWTFLNSVYFCAATQTTIGM